MSIISRYVMQGFVRTSLKFIVLSSILFSFCTSSPVRIQCQASSECSSSQEWVYIDRSGGRSTSCFTGTGSCSDSIPDYDYFVWQCSCSTGACLAVNEQSVCASQGQTCSNTDDVTVRCADCPQRPCASGHCLNVNGFDVCYAFQCYFSKATVQTFNCTKSVFDQLCGCCASTSFDGLQTSKMDCSNDFPFDSPQLRSMASAYQSSYRMWIIALISLIMIGLTV